MRSALLALALLGCKAPGIQLGPTPDADAGMSPGDGLPERALALTGCRAEFEAVDLSGPWVFLIEAASQVTGAGGRAQDEIATRYGVAEICQADGQVSLRTVVCTYGQSPIFDDDLDCAAQLPSADLIALLPEAAVGGTFAPPAIGGTVAITGWSERWGLAPGAPVPAEPNVDEAVVEAGTVDQDEDGDPGVTLRGDGAVPTLGWAARDTVIDLVLEVEDVNVLTGTTRAAVTQSVLGGPAARLLRGRARAPRGGLAAFVRADGTGGTALGDADRDGRFTCGELGRFLGVVLPEPRDPVACRR